jgi:Fic family protein
MPDLVQCAIMHEWFESIHPFIDGNGRVGRLLIRLFLVEREHLSQPLLYLSDYIQARRADYYDLLRRVRTHGDWVTWLRYFLAGVEATARAAAQQTTRILDLRADYYRRLRGKANALALIDVLFGNPYITAARAASLLRVSDPTARNAIVTLEANHILEEITGRSWGRVYRCTAILDAFSRREIASSR